MDNPQTPQPNDQPKKAHQIMVGALEGLKIGQLQKLSHKFQEIENTTECLYCGQPLVLDSTKVVFGDVKNEGPGQVFFGCLDCIKTKTRMLKKKLARNRLFSDLKPLWEELMALIEQTTRADQEQRETRRREMEKRVRLILERESSVPVTDEMVQTEVRELLGE